MRTTNQWTLGAAVELCVRLEPLAAECGGHVALTGGCLYKLGPRKDVDILIYPERGKVFSWNLFFQLASSKLGLRHSPLHDYGWCKKARLEGRWIDFFDPMALNGEHCSGPNITDETDFLG